MTANGNGSTRGGPQIVAHRGASWARPENTAMAFDLALEEGADGLELDLQLTRDDRVVVFHDKTLSRLGLRHRRIAQYRREELRSLDVGSWFAADCGHARLLDLDEVLDRYGTVTDLYLEIKPVGELRKPQRALRLARLVAERVAAHRDLHRIYVLSFSDAVLQCVAQSQAHLRCVRNLADPAHLGEISSARMEELYAVCVDIRRFAPADVARVHAACRHLFAYTVDTPRHLRMARDLHVAVIISNRPAQTRRLLGELTPVAGGS